MASNPIIPRLIRYRDAPAYLGMDKNRFGREVRPHLTQIPIGTQGIAFDRLELDEWVDHYKSRNGRPGQPMGDQLWDAKEGYQAFATGTVSGTSTNRYSDARFAKALEQAISKKQS